MLKKLTQNLTLSKSFLLIMLFFIAGIFISNLIDYDIFARNIIIFAIVLLVIILFVFRKVKIIIIFSLSGIFFLFGIYYYGNYYSNNITLDNIPYGKELNITGIIADEPDIRDDKINLTVRITSSENYQKLKNIKILVKVPRYPEYYYGDELRFDGIIKKPENFQIGNNYFDYEKYLLKDKILGIVDLTKNESAKPEVIAQNKGNDFFAIIYKIKTSFQASINTILPNPNSGLLEGLLLGTKYALPKNLMEIFTIVGLVHIIAVSGYNVTIVVKFFENTTMLWSRNLVFWLGIFGLIAFVILTGAEASVFRAALMASMFLIAKQLGRKGNILISVTFVCCIMILFNPLILKYDIGFQLSFMAVVGLIYIAPLLGQMFKKLNQIIKESFVTTLGAQFTTIPIILFYFGRLSIIAPIANILVLPIIPATMFSGFIAALFGLFIPKIASYIALPCWLFTEYIIKTSEYLAKIKYASVELNFHHWFWVFIYYIILLIIYIMLSKKIKKPIYN